MCQDGCIFEPTWPKINIGDELIDGLRAITREEGKRTVVEIDDIAAKHVDTTDIDGGTC